MFKFMYDFMQKHEQPYLMFQSLINVIMFAKRILRYDILQHVIL